jgi:hypothetical protein
MARNFPDVTLGKWLTLRACYTRLNGSRNLCVSNRRWLAIEACYRDLVARNRDMGQEVRWLAQNPWHKALTARTISYASQRCRLAYSLCDMCRMARTNMLLHLPSYGSQHYFVTYAIWLATPTLTHIPSGSPLTSVYKRALARSAL